MKKNLVVSLMVTIIALLLCLSCSAAEEADYQIIVIGQNGIYDLNSAMTALRQDAGDAIIYLNGPLTLTQQAEIPYGLAGLKSVRLASLRGEPVEVSMSGSVICANGIPFTLDKNVTLRNGFLVGGYCIAQNDTEKAENSVLIINGNADYVIGGGLAMTQGAVSSVKNVDVVINGSASNVHGGGYAFNGGAADVSGISNVILTLDGNVSGALYGGGYAAGAGSSAHVMDAHVVALGSAGSLHASTGLAENGGDASIGNTKIEIVNPQIDSTPNIPGSVITRPDTIPATVMYIGPGQQAQNFTDAVNLLPVNAGNLEFRIMGNFTQKDDVVIPSNRGILSLTISGNNNSRMTVSWPEDVGFFANGIPTTITSSVTFKDGVIYGGANVGTGQQSNLQGTYLDIAGTVNKVVAGSKAKGSAASAHVMNSTLIFRGKATGWLYGGGAALYGAYSAVDGTANMTVTQGASVDLSIAGGGYAFGAGSESVVKDSSMNVAGSVVYAVFLGGYADQSSSAATTGWAFLNLEAAGNIGQSVWYGGRAYKDSNVTVAVASAQVYGRVGATVHKEGRASDGGSVSVFEIR